MRYRCLLATVLTVAALHTETVHAEPSTPERPASTTHDSPQRIAGWVLVGSGIASFAAAIAFGAVAFDAQRSLDAFYGTEPLEDLTARRDACRIGATISGVSGLTFTLAGGLLIALDPSRASVASASLTVKF